MIDKVKKRDGRLIPFNPEKITRAIFLAASEVANKEGITADYQIASELTEEVRKLLNRKFAGKIPSVEDIQDAVIKVLIETGHAKTSETYILYRAERSRIRNSRSRLMKTIEDITFLDANESDIKRENANINGNTAMGTMLQYGSAVSKEFCKDFIIKNEHSMAHDNGEIHIHDMDFLNMGTLTCCQIDLKKVFSGGFSTGHGFLREPQDIMSYAALAAIAIQSNQNDQHGGQSIPNFDYALSEGVKKTFKKLYAENFYKALYMVLGNAFERKAIIDSILKITDETGSAKISVSDEEKNIEAQKISKVYSIDFEQVRKLQAFVYDETLFETDRKTYQAMEAFIHNLNTMHSRAGAQVPFSSVNFGTDISEEGRMISKNLMLSQEKGLGNGETPIFPILIFKVKEGINLNKEDKNYDLFRLAMRVSSKRLFPNFSFLDAPFNIKYYQPDKPETEVVYMGCRTRVMGNVCGEEQAMGRGNLSFTTLNLPRLGIKYGIKTSDRNIADLDGFFEELDEKINLIGEQLLERFEIQASKKVKNFPFLMGQGIWKGSENLGWDDELRDIIKSGKLGQIQKVLLEMPQEGFRRPPDIAGKVSPPQEWRLHDYEIPTICLDLGVHLHHLSTFLLDQEPDSTMANFSNHSTYDGLIDDVHMLLHYPNNMIGHMWMSKTAIGNRNGLKINIYGDRGSAKWIQLNPDELEMNLLDGSRIIIDRASQCKFAGEYRYNRMKPGHPTGFIEAFANLYADINDALHIFNSNQTMHSPFVFGINHASDGLNLFKAAKESHEIKTWVDIIR